MMSGYNKTTESLDRDIIQLLSTFGPLQWLYIWVVLTMFSVVFYCARKHVYGEKRPESIWIVSMFFLGQDYLDEVTFFLKIFSIIMSFFSFFVLTYLQNSANTDLVTKKDPIAIESFKDILERKDVRVRWIKSSIELNQFKFSPIGTIERKIFDEKSFPDERHLINLKDFSPQMAAIWIQSTKDVIIVDKFHAGWLPAICREIREELRDFDTNALIVYLDDSKAFLTAGFVSQQTDHETHKRITRR